MPLLGRVLGSCSGKGATTVCCVVVHMLCGSLYCMSCNITSLHKDIARTAARVNLGAGFEWQCHFPVQCTIGRPGQPGAGFERQCDFPLQSTIGHRQWQKIEGNGLFSRVPKQSSAWAAFSMRATAIIGSNGFFNTTLGEQRNLRLGPKKNRMTMATANF